MGALRIEVNGIEKDFEWQSLNLDSDGSNRSVTKMSILWATASAYNVNTDGKPKALDKVEIYNESNELVFNGFIGRVNKAWITPMDDIAYSIEVFPRYAILAYRYFQRATPYRAIPRTTDLYFDTIIKKIFKEFLEPEGFTAVFNTATNQTDILGTINASIKEEYVDVIVNASTATIQLDFADIGIKNTTDNDVPNTSSASIGRIVYFAYDEEVTILQVLDDLCEKSGYVWRIDPDGVFYFFKPEVGGTVVETISNTTKLSDISMQDSIEKFRNETILVGGDTTLFGTDKVKVDFTGQRSFTFTKRVATITDFRVYTSLDVLKFIVVDEDDFDGLVVPNLMKIKGFDLPENTWEYEPGTRVVAQLEKTVLDNGTTVDKTCTTTDVVCKSLNDLDVGDYIVLKGLFFSPVKLRSTNPVKIREVKDKLGGTGVLQFVESRPDIRTFGLALKTVDGLLIKYGNTRETYSFQIPDANLKVLTYKIGNLVVITGHTLIPDGLYSIGSIGISMFSTESLEASLVVNKYNNVESWREYWKDSREINGAFEESKETEFTTAFDESIIQGEIQRIQVFGKISMYPASNSGALGGVIGQVIYNNWSPNGLLYIK